MAGLVTFSLIDALTQGRGDVWFEPIRDACEAWEINTEHRVAMFLANCMQESRRLRSMVEDLRYSAKTLRGLKKYFTAEDAERMAYDEFAIAERMYGGRMGNGPEGSGDGFKYRGHGPPQLTGRNNYRRIGQLIGWDLEAEPNQIVVPLWGAYAAAAFWDSTGCSKAADDDDFEGVCKIVNVGDRYSTVTPNGMPDRLAMLQEVQEAMA